MDRRQQNGNSPTVNISSTTHTTNQLTQMAREALTDAISIFSAKKPVVAIALYLSLGTAHWAGQTFDIGRHLFNGVLVFTFIWQLSVSELHRECVPHSAIQS